MLRTLHIARMHSIPAAKIAVALCGRRVTIAEAHAGPTRVCRICVAAADRMGLDPNRRMMV